MSGILILATSCVQYDYWSSAGGSNTIVQVIEPIYGQDLSMVTSEHHGYGYTHGYRYRYFNPPTRDQPVTMCRLG